MAREVTTKGRDKLAERYVRYGDPRSGKVPSSDKAAEHAANRARKIERKRSDER